jgi:hypothetical protein
MGVRVSAIVGLTWLRTEKYFGRARHEEEVAPFVWVNE